MDKPKCRLCGTKHWKNENCVFPDGPKKIEDVQKAVAAVKKDPAEVLKVEPAELITTGDPTMEELQAAFKKLTDRRHYMKKYMKDRRAEEKK